MNKSEKSLRWVVNQIPDFKPTTNEEKMLVAIKLYSEAGAEEIRRLETENAALRARLNKAVELPSGDRVWFITEDEEGKESYIISKPTDGLTVDELYEIGKKYFTNRAEAEARLAEMKGEEK